MKHIDVRQLHLQALVRDGRNASIYGGDTEVTEDDTGTEHHAGERLRTLVKLLGMTLTEEKATAGLIHVSKQKISKLLAAVQRQT